MHAINIILALAGAALCVSTICTASHMPTKSSWTICLLVAGTFASSVGVVVTSVSGDLPKSFEFACGSITLLLGQVLWARSNGVRPLDFLNPIRGHDANQH